MKKLLPIIFIFVSLKIFAQSGMYRHFPQPTPTLSFSGCEIKNPIKTQDGGYIFGYLFWIMGFEFPGGPVSYYTVKTDSNLVPQWKKPGYSSAIALPTGGIILLTNGSVEKVTASGTQVWRKEISGSIVLNDGINYSDKIRLVGKKAGYAPYMVFWVVPTSTAYSSVMDTTSGTISSESWFGPVSGGNAEFSKIKMDGAGNFIVYSSRSDSYFPITEFSFAKFDTSFNFIWAKTWANSSYFLPTDIDILPSGSIFCTGVAAPSKVGMIKFDSQGNIISQSYFPNSWKISGLCKKQNGHYIASTMFQDSLFMFETDTSMNISWNKYFARGQSIGQSFIKNNQLFTPVFYGFDPVIVSNDLSGNSCRSLPRSFSQTTSSISVTNFTLNLVNDSTTINTSTVNSITTQNYVDSCKCPVFIMSSPNILCVGNSGTINVSGNGNLSWYATATGNSFIQSGPQFVFSSFTPTVKTVFAQDSTCVNAPNRTQINITVYGQPTLSFSPPNPTICMGNQIFLYASGANSYEWGNGDPFYGVAILNPTASTIYTVIGTNAPGCSDTETVSITVVPKPTLTLSPLTSICLGSIATLTASGALSYTWNANWNGPNLNNSPSYTANLAYPGQYIYTVYGTTDFCVITAQTTLVVSQNPALSLTSSDSTICAGHTSTLMVSGANTYTWSNSLNSQSILVIPLVNTIYTVTGSNASNCTDTKTISLTVFPMPTLVTSSYSVCEGAQITLTISGANSYSWSTGDSTNYLNISALLGNTIYTVTGANGICTTTASAFVYASTVPTLNFASTPTVFCEGKTTTLTVSGANSFTWSNSSSANNIVINPTSNVNFSVTGVNGNCFSSDSISIFVYSNPTLMLSSSQQSICVGETITLLANGATYYNWSTGSNINIISQNPQTNTVYSVIGTNTAGCSDSKTISIIVNPLPVITATSNQSVICSGETSTFTAMGANSYSWNGIPGPSVFTISPISNTEYTIYGLDANGCAAQTTIFQNVSLCTGLEHLKTQGISINTSPNPNSGQFQLNVSVIDDLDMHIYNTIGELILAKKIDKEITDIDLRNYVAGVYYLKLSNKEESAMLKVIIQR